MKNWVFLLLMIMFINDVRCEIIKCKDANGYVKYGNTETKQDVLEIHDFITQGFDCDKLDKRSPEQKKLDNEAMETRERNERELARLRYLESVKATAKFLDDVERERKKNK